MFLYIFTRRHCFISFFFNSLVIFNFWFLIFINVWILFCFFSADYYFENSPLQAGEKSQQRIKLCSTRRTLRRRRLYATKSGKWMKRLMMSVATVDSLKQNKKKIQFIRCSLVTNTLVLRPSFLIYPAVVGVRGEHSLTKVAFWNNINKRHIIIGFFMKYFFFKQSSEFF